MTARLTRAEVDRIAELARLELSSEEADLFTRQLAAILEFAAQIGKVDTAGVGTSSHVLAPPLLRADDAKPSLPREAALANAPEPSGESGLFKVPRVIG